jgi:ribonuclease P protein component
MNPNSKQKSHSLRPAERLKSPERVSDVFKNGKRIAAYPLSMMLAPGEGSVHRVAFAVPKRKIRKAVHRNLIKRRMREAYRTHKHLLPEGPPMDMVLLYQAQTQMEFQALVESLTRILAKL